GQFLTEPVRDLAYDGMVDPQWIGKTNRFWYRKEGPFGKQFTLVDVAALTTAPAFDHQKIAAALSSATKQSFTARDLPVDPIRFIDSERALQFAATGATWTCRLDSYACTRSSDPFDYDGSDGAAGRGGPATDRLPRTEVPSPDGKLLAFVRDHDLWVRVKA